MGELERIERKMKEKKSAIDEMKANYKKLEKEYKQEQKKQELENKRINELKKKIKEMDKNQADFCEEDISKKIELLELAVQRGKACGKNSLNDLKYMLWEAYLHRGDYTCGDGMQMADLEKEEDKEMLEKRIKFLEQAVEKRETFGWRDFSNTLCEMWQAYQKAGYKEKAAEAEERYRKEDERESHHWDCLDNIH